VKNRLFSVDLCDALGGKKLQLVIERAQEITTSEIKRGDHVFSEKADTVVNDPEDEDEEKTAPKKECGSKCF